MADLEGRWAPDSTYTVEDTRATHLLASDLQLEIFSDATISVADSLNLTFQGKVKGRITLSGDTLFLQPVGGGPSSAPDTFIVKLRFLGNRLELDHPIDQRFTFFHKRRLADFEVQDSLLRDSLWLLKARRVDPESLHIEPLLKDFTYLRFPSGELFRDWHRNGVFRTDSGSLTKVGRVWTWTTSGESRKFLADLIDKDTLRIWPLVADKPDSGFDIYTRATRRHTLDLDVRLLLGHMRTDSIRSLNSTTQNHYGKFFDLEFGEDHSVVTQTNMPSMPNFKTWTLDTGQILLEGSGDTKVRFRVDTTLPKVVKLTTDSGKFFNAETNLFQTRVNAERFIDHPLDRFDQVSYAHVLLGSDTLRYYFEANFLKGNPDDHEILRIDPTDTSWLTFRINPSQESFQSSQTGFRFLMEGRTVALGKFTCKALPAGNMVIRLTSTSDPTMAQGLIQGPCHILTSEKAPSDSNLALDGTFKLKRKTVWERQSPLWSK